MKKKITHRFEVNSDTWWSDVFFDPQYLEALHIQGLGCRSFEVLALDRNSDGSVRQELQTEPAIVAPPVIRKAIGERVRYREVGRFDPIRKRYDFQIIPSTLGKAAKIAGTISLQPRGEHAIDRICDLEFRVDVFGVGKLIEAFIGRSYVQNIELAAGYTRQWIADQVAAAGRPSSA